MPLWLSMMSKTAGAHSYAAEPLVHIFTSLQEWYSHMQVMWMNAKKK